MTAKFKGSVNLLGRKLELWRHFDYAMYVRPHKNDIEEIAIDG